MTDQTSPLQIYSTRTIWAKVTGNDSFFKCHYASWICFSNKI